MAPAPPTRSTPDPVPGRAGSLGQDLDVPVRSLHADPLSIPAQLGGLLYPDDGRHAVLPCDHRDGSALAPRSQCRAQRSRWISSRMTESDASTGTASSAPGMPSNSPPDRMASMTATGWS